MPPSLLPRPGAHPALQHELHSLYQHAGLAGPGACRRQHGISLPSSRARQRAAAVRMPAMIVKGLSMSAVAAASCSADSGAGRGTGGAGASSAGSGSGSGRLLACGLSAGSPERLVPGSTAGLRLSGTQAAAAPSRPRPAPVRCCAKRRPSAAKAVERCAERAVAAPQPGGNRCIPAYRRHCSSKVNFLTLSLQAWQSPCRLLKGHQRATACKRQRWSAQELPYQAQQAFR